jgi:hypothetical protein
MQPIIFFMLVVVSLS